MIRLRPLFPLSFLACALAVLACGCSSFEREWSAAAARPAPSGGLEGQWQGIWRSHTNGHKGALRCIVTRTNDHYSARFHAKYKKVFQFSFGYTVPLAVVERDNAFQLEGAADLGWMAGGRYTYQGRATATNFFSTYSSKYDHGVFEMTRPAP